MRCCTECAHVWNMKYEWMMGVTFAIWSNLPKSSFSICTSSPGEQSLANLVKPTMSAYRMLQEETTLTQWGINLGTDEEYYRVFFTWEVRTFCQNQQNVGGCRGNICVANDKILIFVLFNFLLLLASLGLFLHSVLFGTLQGQSSSAKIMNHNWE